MSRRNAQIAAVLAVIVAGAAAYRWWSSPGRQIRAVLDDVAAAFTHDESRSGLDALTAAAGLQPHLAADVVLEAGATRITGRQEAISAAARIRAGSPMMRVRFFDPRVTMDGDASATVWVTAEVTSASSSGEEIVEVHQIVAMLIKSEGRWRVSAARTTSEGEPAS